MLSGGQNLVCRNPEYNWTPVLLTLQDKTINTPLPTTKNPDFFVFS